MLLSPSQTNAENAECALNRALDLLENAKRFNQENEFALRLAIEEHDLEVVKILIEHPEIDINKSNEDIALHIAAERYHYKNGPEVFFALFSHPKIDVNLQDRYGHTACYALIFKDLVEEKARLIFNDSRLKVNTVLLGHALSLDNLVVFKILMDRLRLEKTELFIPSYWNYTAIPDPEINPVRFVSHGLVGASGAYKIQAYYAVLDELKEDGHLKYDEVFNDLEKQKFPRHETWPEEHKKIAFYYARHTLELMPEHFFALIVFYCDGLLQLKNPNKAADIDLGIASNVRRFLTMAERLPMETQMKLCHTVAGQAKELIPGKDSEIAFKTLAAKCAP